MKIMISPTRESLGIPIFSDPNQNPFSKFEKKKVGRPNLNNYDSIPYSDIKIKFDRYRIKTENCRSFFFLRTDKFELRTKRRSRYLRFNLPSLLEQEILAIPFLHEEGFIPSQNIQAV